MDSSDPSGGLRRPLRLRPGDRLAAVTLSWGGPGEIPQRYQAGKRQLEATFGVSVVEMPHTLADPSSLAEHPQARVDDLHRALTDPDHVPGTGRGLGRSSGPARGGTFGPADEGSILR